MNKQYRIKASKSEFGSSCYYIECPFCRREIKAYIWSLAGCGKRCYCGAKHTYLNGTVPPAAQGEQKTCSSKRVAQRKAHAPRSV